MVCTANELSAWKDFPKGLRVLLLDENADSAADIKAKLEAMDYIVFMFCNVNEALLAVSGNHESFHVAIVEVSSSNGDERFKFLERAKELPTIMTSNLHCLSTMMKCIALGAVEFVRKPLSEDKLRNIWQHVVHKAFNAGGSAISESLRPVKDSVASMIQLEVTCENNAVENIENMECECLDRAEDLGHSPANDKYPAPSTPQLEQGIRLLDDGDCQDHTNSSSEKESGEQELEYKSVENTCRVDEVTADEGHPQSSADMVIKKENEATDEVKEEVKRFHPPKVNRKKLKVDWTPDLHKKFVQAAEQLGVDQAIPSRILELMNVEGLTRHNVASHLQKYRMHRRNILPKLDDGRWQLQKDNAQSNYYMQRPTMAYPSSYHSGHNFCHGPVYPVWGAAGTPQFSPPMWGPTSYHPWTPTDGWHWMTHPGMHADAWGCPVMPPPGGHFTALPQAPPEIQVLGDDEQYSLDYLTLHQNLRDNVQRVQAEAEAEEEEEVIDKVVKEAMNKPWLPLPLGLKPPSTDTVLAELSRQGISNVPHLPRSTPLLIKSFKSQNPSGFWAPPNPELN